MSLYFLEATAFAKLFVREPGTDSLIRLNRAEAGIPEETQRFHPVAAHGDSIAEAIEEERGNL